MNVASSLYPGDDGSADGGPIRDECAKRRTVVDNAAKNARSDRMTDPWHRTFGSLNLCPTPRPASPSRGDISYANVISP